MTVCAAYVQGQEIMRERSDEAKEEEATERPRLHRDRLRDPDCIGPGVRVVVRWALAMCSGMVRTPGIRTCGVIGAGDGDQ